MFTVSRKTVELLCDAQDDRLSGTLRLDVSSAGLPTDPLGPCDVEAARVAIGERVVRLLGTLADESTVDQVTLPGHMLVCSKRGRFTLEVTRELVPLLGLDRRKPQSEPAITELANDFFDWAERKPEAKTDFDIELKDGAVYVLCRSLDADFRPLPDPDHNLSGEALCRFLQNIPPLGSGRP